MTTLFQFWSRLPPGEHIHPEDKPFLAFNKEHTFRTEHRPPGPYDGPLALAKVVVCYANPGLDYEDINWTDEITRQLTGREDLPDIPGWREWYWRRLRRIGLPFDETRKLVAIFNVCPYTSKEMAARDIRVAAGLPSVWAAQKHLHEVLIPKALKGDLFLVIARKHQLWGVVEGFDCRNIRFIRNLGGYLGEELSAEIGSWLASVADSSGKK